MSPAADLQAPVSAAACTIDGPAERYAVQLEQFGVGDAEVRSADASAWGGRGYEYHYGRRTPEQARTSVAGAELYGGVVLAADASGAADDLRQLVDGWTATWTAEPIATRRLGDEMVVARRRAPWTFADGTTPDEVLLAFRACNVSAYVAVTAAPELDPVGLAVHYAGAVAARLEAAGAPTLTGPPADVIPAELPALRVVGTSLQDESGRAVRLRGVNLPGLEWSDGRPELAEAVDHAASAWGARAIRLPLAQDRWFGRANGLSDGGAVYRRAVDALVTRANARGAYVILTLQWSNGGRWEQDGGLVGQHCMPDEHSRAFWSDVAARYAQRTGVLFGLYNEPYDVAPAVWRDGGRVAERGWRRTHGPGDVEPFTTCADRAPDGAGWESLGAWEYDSPGMQGLVDAVRGAGASQVVLVGGLTFAYDLEAALAAGPLRDDNLMYDVHLYPGVSSVKDWDAAWLRATERVPVWVGEWGCAYGDANGLIACGDRPDGEACPSPWARTALRVLDERGLSWTAWSFNPEAMPSLVEPAGAWTDYLPTPVGRCALGSLRR